jgi:hypothetical protein
MQNIVSMTGAKLTENDYRLLVRAANVLENPGLAARISQLVGMPIEKAMAALPGHWSSIVGRITKAVRVTTIIDERDYLSMKPEQIKVPSAPDPVPIT